MTSQQYWIKRMDEIMAYVDKTDLDFFDELQSIYTENRQNIQKEIYKFYTQYAKENLYARSKKTAHEGGLK